MRSRCRQRGRPSSAARLTHCRLICIRSFFQGYNRCCLVGHDWGGTVAWLFAIHYPEMVTKLIVLNCPHPSVFSGETLTRIRSRVIPATWRASASALGLLLSLLSLIRQRLRDRLHSVNPLQPREGNNEAADHKEPTRSCSR